MSFLFDLLGQDASVVETVGVKRKRNSAQTAHAIGHLYLNIERVTYYHLLDVKQIKFNVLFAWRWYLEQER